MFALKIASLGQKEFVRLAVAEMELFKEGKHAMTVRLTEDTENAIQLAPA
jgi:hypothetical protein